MRSWYCMLGLALWLVTPVRAQDAGRTIRESAAPTVVQADTTDWPLHNLDVRNTRYASLDQINTSNVASLVLKWSYQLPRREIVRAVTPLVIDGVLYVNSGSKLTAVNASTGETVWHPGVFCTIWRRRPDGALDNGPAPVVVSIH